MKKEINTVSDVEEFFRYLRDERKVAFLPDDDFCCYINRDTGEPTFTDEEVATFNAMMNQCFDVCETNGKDIYEIGCAVLFQIIQ